MGHIRLSREADLVVVAPATADLMAKMAAGLADDLASTLLLASDKPVLVAPAMNPQMWAHPATRRNLARLAEDGVRIVGPNPGDMACGEVGSGRMAEPHEILAAIEAPAGAAGAPAGRAARRGDQRPDPRAARPGPLPVQPLVRPAGPCHRAGPGRGRCGRHAGQRAGAGAGPAGRHGRACRDRRARCWRRSRRRCRPTSPSAPPRSPTGGRRGCRAPARSRSARASRRPRSSWSRTRTSCAPWPRMRRPPGLVIGFAAETGDLEASRRGPSWRARAATGSWPTTSRRAPACSAATRNQILLLTGDGPGGGLAGARQAGAWPAGWWRGSPRTLGRGRRDD